MVKAIYVCVCTICENDCDIPVLDSSRQSSCLERTVFEMPNMSHVGGEYGVSGGAAAASSAVWFFVRDSIRLISFRRITSNMEPSVASLFSTSFQHGS